MTAKKRARMPSKNKKTVAGSKIGRKTKPAAKERSDGVWFLKHVPKGMPVLHVNEDDDLPTIYRKAREQFTAADLQRYTVDEPMVPFEEVLEDLERIQRKTPRKRG